MYGGFFFLVGIWKVLSEKVWKRVEEVFELVGRGAFSL